MITKAENQWLCGVVHCLVVVMTVGAAAAPARVAAGSLAEAKLACAEEETLARVLDARWALEKRILDQLLVLHGEGNATWLETARQQIIVDTLQAQRAATHELATFIESLRDRIKHSGTGESELVDARDDLPVIKLTLPGSQRLVGWLAWDQASAAMRASYVAALRASSTPQADGEKQIDLAAEKVATYNQRVSRLAEITGSDKARKDLARAELQLAVARAELELARVMRQRQQSESACLQRAATYLDEDSSKGEDPDIAPPAETALLVTADTAYITHQADPALRTATLAAAAQEARNQGALRAAEFNLRQLQGRADDTDQLHAAGLVTRREVQQVREEINSAKALLESLRAKRSNLIDVYESLRQSADQDGSPSPSLRFASTPADASSATQHEQQDLASLPMSCLTDAAVVRHVIDLNRQRWRAEARRGALTAKLNMLENLEARLAKAEKSLAARQTQASASAKLDEMRAVLAEGRRKELENVRLNIELTKAQRLATVERLQVLRLEKDRFAHQIIQQFTRADARGSDLANGSLPAGERFVAMVERSSETEHMVKFELGRLQRTPLCYLESHDVFINAMRLARSSAPLGPVKSATAFQPNWLRPSRHIDPLALAPWQPSSPTVYDRTYNQLRHRYGNGFAYSPRGFASPLSSYYDEYDSFGDRRAAAADKPFRRFDRRHPFTYLPGTPARLPGTPRYLPGTPRRYECELR